MTFKNNKKKKKLGQHNLEGKGLNQIKKKVAREGKKKDQGNVIKEKGGEVWLNRGWGGGRQLRNKRESNNLRIRREEFEQSQKFILAGRKE